MSVEAKTWTLEEDRDDCWVSGGEEIADKRLGGTERVSLSVIELEPVLDLLEGAAKAGIFEKRTTKPCPCDICVGLLGLETLLRTHGRLK